MDKKFFKPILKNLQYNFQALNFAYKKHQPNKQRAEGHPQIFHPTRIANYLVSLFGGYKSAYQNPAHKKMIEVALLHDTLEDTSTTYEELVKKFGVDTADGVLALTNPAHLSSTGKKAEYLLEKMKKMDPDILLVKLADRLDNIKTLYAMPEEKQQQTVKDTEFILKGLTSGEIELSDYHSIVIKDIKREMKRYVVNEKDKNK